jgi:hypothetical protein
MGHLHRFLFPHHRYHRRHRRHYRRPRMAKSDYANMVKGYTLLVWWPLLAGIVVLFYAYMVLYIGVYKLAYNRFSDEQKAQTPSPRNQHRKFVSWLRRAAQPFKFAKPTDLRKRRRPAYHHTTHVQVTISK